MHHSRVWGIVIDCDNLDAGIRFWSAALGTAVKMRGEQYTSLQPAGTGLRVVLQHVPESKTAKSRIHFDIETDDVNAELARLEVLGARRVGQAEDWWIMNDPCGNEFCIVPIQSEDFPAGAREWADS